MLEPLRWSARCLAVEPAAGWANRVQGTVCAVEEPSEHVLLLSCADRNGIVAAVTAVLCSHGANIIDAQQHMDSDSSMFFQRIVFTCVAFDEPSGAESAATLSTELAEVAATFSMDMELRRTSRRARMVVLAGPTQHCLIDVLARAHSGRLAADVVAVLSTSDAHAGVAGMFDVPFHHVPVADTSGAARAVQESRVLDLVGVADADLVVLARYMRVLSDAAVAEMPVAINIHHSFLPAFVGARPYQQAHARGVKVIGATAHYVTAELDEGPIIAQDVVRVSHRDSAGELAVKGADVEVTVLARALAAHLSHRVLRFGNRTVVFD